MKKEAAVLASFLSACVILAGPASALSPPPKKETAPEPAARRLPARAVDAAQEKFLFTPEETLAIRDFFRTAPQAGYAEPAPGKKMKTLPPGLRKKIERGRELPPGWQKKIARGEVIDAQVYEHSRLLPQGLIERLPPPPDGTVVVTVEGKVVRLMEATRTILDVFDLPR